eukprot:12402506-Alexandrium_andersonii.AAC.1
MCIRDRYKSDGATTAALLNGSYWARKDSGSRTPSPAFDDAVAAAQQQSQQNGAKAVPMIGSKRRRGDEDRHARRQPQKG